MKNFKQVAVKNFFSFGPQEQTLDLTGEGMININGLNGVGKTTLTIEAIIFAVYGKSRQDKIEDVVNRSIGKDCKVSLEFVGDDDETYKIIRYRNHSVHKNAIYLFKGDKDISCKNAKDTDALIQDYVGMPYIAFVNSTLFSSELYSNFLSAKNSERLGIFENILSLKEVTAFYLETKKVIKEIEEKKQEQEIQLAAKKAEEESINGSIDSYSKNAKAKLLEIKQKKTENETLKEELEKELSSLKEIDIESEKKKIENGTLKAELKEKIAELEKELKDLNSFEEPEENTVFEKYKNFDFEENKKKEEEYKEKTEQKEKLDKEFELKHIELANLSSKRGKLESDLERENKDLNDKQNKLEKIKENICPFCGQKMNAEETEKKRTLISDEIKNIEENISKLTNEISELKDKEYSLGIEKLEILEKTNKLNINKDFLENSDLLKERFENAKKIVDNYNKQLPINEEKKNKISKEISELKEKSDSLETAKYSIDFLDNLFKETKEKEKQINECDSFLNSVSELTKMAYDKTYIDELKENLKTKQDEKAELEKVLSETENEIKHYEYLAECFSNKSGGFKKYFIGEMIDVFNDKINQYLPFFFNEDLKINFDKELIDTITLNKKEISFSSLSCGQKTRAELAVAFALFNVSRIFFANDCGFLVIDELLDRGLDEMGIKSAISLLENFAEDSKIFIVSHNQAVKENITESLEIRKDENNFSYIVA